MNDVQTLVKSIDATRRALAALNQESDDIYQGAGWLLRRKLEVGESEHARLDAELAELRAPSARIEASLARLDASLAKLESSLAEAREREAYVTKRAEVFRSLGIAA